MFDELAIARADGRLSRLMTSWARIDVLVIDGLLNRPLNPDQAADLLEAIEDRTQLHSTVVTSQLPVAHWHEALGDAAIADAVLDRLLERANRIELIGESLRRSTFDDHTAKKDKVIAAEVPRPPPCARPRASAPANYRSSTAKEVS